MEGRVSTYRRTCLFLVAVVIFYIFSFGLTVKKDCYSFCVGREPRKNCFSSKFAIFVYRDEINTQDMFFQHKFQPSISFPEYLSELLMGQYNAEECFMDSHFPEFTVFAPQTSCAIIGNGGILRNSGCGKEIDSHDFVMRMNLAPLTGFQADVGSKAHLNLVNYEKLTWLYGNLTQQETGDSKKEDYLRILRNLNDSVIWYPKDMNRIDTRYFFQSIGHVLRDVHQLPVKLAYSWKPVSIEKYFHLRQKATSGFNMYAIAKTFCSHITLYGFYPYDEDDRGFRIPHHYYDDHKDFMYRGRVHNFVAEFKQLQKIASEQSELRLVTEKCTDMKRILQPHKNRNSTFVNPLFLFKPRMPHQAGKD